MIYPLMKVLFPSAKKVALNIIKGIFVDTKINEWITPGGLFEIWGYPKKVKMNRCLYDIEVINESQMITELMINKHSVEN
jgi:hypothetical protein